MKVKMGLEKMKNKIINYLKLIDIFLPYIFSLFLIDLIPMNLRVLSIYFNVIIFFIMYIIFRYINIKEKILDFTDLIFEFILIISVFKSLDFDKITVILILLSIFLSMYKIKNINVKFIKEIIKYILYGELIIFFLLIIFISRLELIYI